MSHQEHKALIAWSSGKDSAWVLHLMRQKGDLKIAGLLTTITETFNRVSMHGVRREIVERQALNANLPLFPVTIPFPCSNEEYEKQMNVILSQAKSQGVTHIAFGDLYLEDIRQYRIKQLRTTGIEPLFPTWVGPNGTATLAREMIASGIKTKVVCIDPKQLDPSFVGREWNEEFLKDLPEKVDPCGEKGEFHTCCYSGPIFRDEIQLESGEKIKRDGFWFADFKLKKQEVAGPSWISEA